MAIMNARALLVILATAVLAAGCASSPVAPGGVEVAPYGPAHVLSGEAQPGDRVVWGGRIVAIDNLAEHTELTVASYPLDRADRPRFREQAGVRFVLIEDGFLEPVEWRRGRYITVLGVVDGIEERVTGEYVHPHPLLQAEKLHLWPADPAEWQRQTGFRLGVGIRL